MNNPIRVYYNPDFIATCITNLFDDPFWDEDNDGKVKELSDANRLTYLSSTLPSFGFFNLTIGNKLVPIQVNGNIAREINQKDLRDFSMYVLNRVPNGNKVLDRMVIKYNNFFDEKVLTSLRCIDREPLKDTRYSAYRYYQNGVVEVNSKCDSVKLLSYDVLDALVWADRVIDRQFDTNSICDFDQDTFLGDITNNPGNHFHKWCQNLCKSQDHSGVWTFNQNRFKALAS